MRSLAVGSAILVGILVNAVPVGVATDTSADCEDPPGGRITCEDTQAAFCKVTRGKVEGNCRTPPRNLKGADLSAWVLSEIMGETVDAKQAAAGKYSNILKDKRWKSANTVVTFRLPNR
jgi:hypothetical protein